MNRPFRASMALAAVALAGLTAQTAHAQLSYSNLTETFAIDPSDATFSALTVDHTVNYQVDGPNGATDTPTLNVYGEVNTFTWTASPGTSISGLSTSVFTSTATATLASNGATGAASYDYLSHNGDGIAFVGVNPANSQIEALIDTSLADSAAPALASEIDIVLPGDWSTFGADGHEILAGSFSISPDYTVTNNFGYDAGYNATFFQAIYSGTGTAAPNVSFVLNGVPEPGNVATLAGLTLSGLGFAASRLRRRAR